MSPRAAAATKTPRKRTARTASDNSRRAGDVKAAAPARPERQPQPEPQPEPMSARRTVAGKTVLAERSVANLPGAPLKFRELDLDGGDKVLECMDCGTIANNRSAMMLHRRDVHGNGVPGRRRGGNGGLSAKLAAMTMAEVVSIVEGFNGLGEYIDRLETDRDTYRDRAIESDRKYRALVRALDKAGLQLKVEDDD